MKTCGNCGELKSDSSFYPDRRTGDGLSWECKDCGSVRRKEYYRQNKEVWRRNHSPEYRKEYYEKNKEEIKARQKKMYRRAKKKEKIFVEEKTCAGCGKTKGRDDFYENLAAADGLYSYCKVCHKKIVAKGQAERQRNYRRRKKQ